MTIKEITELRKSGHLAEAMAAAEIEFSKAANQYTAGALFWCLNARIKQQSSDDLVAIFERMKALYNEFLSGDEYVQTAMNSAEKSICPHYSELPSKMPKTVLMPYLCTSKYQIGISPASLTQGFTPTSVG